MFNPLKVHFPCAGKYLLLHYTSLWNGGHVILSPHRKSLTHTAQRAFEDYLSTNSNSFISLKIESLSLIEMVAPSEKMCQLATKSYQQEQAAQLTFTLQYELANLLENKPEIKLPLGFSKCQDFKSAYNEFAYTDKEDQYKHYMCENCVRGIVLNLSEQELYQKYAESWYQKYPRNQEANLQYSRAEPAKNSEKIWAADSYLSSGVSLFVMKRENMTDPTSRLFYYRRLEKLDFSPEQLILDNMKDKIAEEEVLRKKEYQEKYSAEQEAKNQEILEFFGINKE